MSRYDILLNDPRKPNTSLHKRGDLGEPSSDQPTARPLDQAVARRSDRPTANRVLVRRGFEWYEDQLAALKKLSLQEQMEGKPGSMSQMVRDAVDTYLRKRSTET